MEYAPNVYCALKGVFCIYKPAGKSMKGVVHALQVKLANDLNGLKTRPIRERVVLHENNVDSSLPVVTTVPDLADHPLVLGPRYQSEDFHVGYVSRLARNSSGIVVMGIDAGTGFLKHIARSRYIRTYHVKGQLGLATRDMTPGGRIIEKSTYHHVTHYKIDKVIAAMQAGHQKHMFEAAGIDRQSQEAYEIASKGFIRPDTKEAGPVIYGMKCVHFEPPHFTLEIHSINEDCDYLVNLIHNLGLELKSSAVCTQVRRVRFGHFSLTHALLYKHWNAQCILENIDFCRPLLKNLNRDPQSKQLSEERSEDPNPQNPKYLPDR